MATGSRYSPHGGGGATARYEREPRAAALRFDEQAVTGMDMPDGMTGTGLRHMLFAYRDVADYQACLTWFAEAAAARGDPMLVMLPRSAPRPPAWPGRPAGADAPDMADVGRNPARVISELRSFADAHRDRPIAIIAEWIWSGRSQAEVCEAALHEALLARALAGVPATVLCPYNEALAPRSVLADARSAHPWELRGGKFAASAGYAGPAWTPASCQAPLPSPPPDAEAIAYRSDLRAVRAMVTRFAERAGLSAARVTDLMLAVSEIAANTLRHTRSGGVARAWQADGEVLCEVTDTGYIRDPLAGLRRPSLTEPGGQGLWLVNQVCDLVELRSATSGTSVRLHMRVAGA
jgi:anti-sigma regulatory factor (Ser/Thr protein kinase)